MQTNDPHSEIIVVSGLPRSGTSLMMKMLAAGGLPLLVDGLREPDDDNPEGYFELERVKALVTGDDAWLAEARGHAVKVISSLLKFLPGTYSYRVILMQRRMSEVLASQRRMLMRRGEPVDTLSDEKLAVISVRHLQQVQSLAGRAAQHHRSAGGLQRAGGRPRAIHHAGEYLSWRIFERICYDRGRQPSALSESLGGLLQRRGGHRQRPCRLSGKTLRNIR